MQLAAPQFSQFKNNHGSGYKKGKAVGYGCGVNHPPKAPYFSENEYAGDKGDTLP